MDILLVDDSRVMRQLVRRTLRQAGYDVGQVTEAENGQDALTKLKSFKPDLVLSDWNMPTMNGFELLTALRAENNQVPLGFVTSESTPAMKAKAAGGGALFLLTKPFTAEDFRRVLIAAGLKPGNAITAADREVVADGAIAAFNDKLLAKLLSNLINAPVNVVPGPKLVTAVTPCISVTWIDPADKLLYAGFCELPVAVYLGAVMGMRPPAVVKEMLRERVLPDTARADAYEVFNVLSRAFNDAGSVHVRLKDITFPPTPALPLALQTERTSKSRLDFTVTVQGHGSGKLSLVSTANPPDFILKDLTGDR